MNNIKTKSLIIIFLSCIYSTAQIKTVIIETYNKRNTSFIELNSGFKLYFDDLNPNIRNLTYKITVCNYNWQPLEFYTSSFIEGFDSGYIEKFKQSINTSQEYTHYQLKIPNESTKIIKSGNYLIEIHDDDNLVFTKKIYIYSNNIKIEAKTTRSLNPKYLNKKQNIELSFTPNITLMQNSSDNIKVVIIKNNDFNFSKKQVKPSFVTSDKWVFKNDKKTDFWAGNEFLYIDAKSIYNSPYNVKSTKTNIEGLHFYLYDDYIRANFTYTYFPDINGDFKVNNTDSEYDNIDSEYINIHFSLNTGKELKDDLIYVYGGYNNYKTEPENLMKYNKETKKYTTSIKLKQGFTNYKYITVNKQGVLNEIKLNGSYFETENEYSIIIYQRDIDFNTFSIEAIKTIKSR